MNLNEFLTALCIKREAENQPDEGKAAIAWVITNRALKKVQTPAQIVLHPFAFSSFNLGNLRSVVFFKDETELQQYLEFVFDVGLKQDPTNGATHYHAYEPGDPRWPHWATDDKFTVQIGQHRFYHNIPF